MLGVRCPPVLLCHIDGMKLLLSHGWMKGNGLASQLSLLLLLSSPLASLKKECTPQFYAANLLKGVNSTGARPGSLEVGSNAFTQAEDLKRGMLDRGRMMSMMVWESDKAQ